MEFELYRYDPEEESRERIKELMGEVERLQKRVTDLLNANNAEVERRRTAESAVQRKQLAFDALLTASGMRASESQAEIQQLRQALVEAALPLEVLGGQISVKAYTEMTKEFQDQILAAVMVIRNAVASTIQKEAAAASSTLLHRPIKLKTFGQAREQAISFAYGNVALDNPAITREMVAEQYDALHDPKPQPAPATDDAALLDALERMFRNLESTPSFEPTSIDPMCDYAFTFRRKVNGEMFFDSLRAAIRAAMQEQPR